jgi:hypothetical protein
MKEMLMGVIAEIEKEIRNLEELKAELDKVKPETGIIFKRSKGSILHDFYNCCERVFKRIALELNGRYEDSEKWHKDLLYRMTIPIKGIRPSVISDELAAMLDEFLAFRHVFRNIYGFELKGERIDYLSGKFDEVMEKFKGEIEKFIAFLREELD